MPTTTDLVSARDPDWLAQVVERLSSLGYAAVTHVLAEPLLEETRAAMYRVQQAITGEVGRPALDRAGEHGVLRLMFKFDDVFLRLLAVPELLAVVDATLGSTAILHLQNGFILPSTSEQPGSVFQTSLHRDFPRYMNGYLASVNAMFAIDAFRAGNGATLVVPGTHQQREIPDVEQLRSRAIPVECPAGSMVVFDSTLWHAGGHNVSGADRLAINHQFTRSFFKQQIDYVRALGDRVVTAQPPRTQQLLGWYTRVVTSLDEYYRPESERLYRKGQG